MNHQHKIKILIADDSFFMRKLLARLLTNESDIEVVGEAKDGKEIVELAKHLRPDVITMDYNMPELNGAMATREILSDSNFHPAIIMLSAFTKEGAQETLECLHAGAVDFLQKPSGELSLDIDKVGDELLQKIRVAAHAHVRIRMESKKVYKPIPVLKKPLLNGRKKEGVPKWLILIGASTGGPPVVEEILAHMHPNMDAAILIVQHMPPHFTKSFAQRLDKFTPFTVNEAKEGDKIVEGTVLVAPGDFHMKIQHAHNEQYSVHLTQDPVVSGIRPSIDVLFFSAVKRWEGKIIAVELTGMGQDGLDGMHALKAAGAYVVVQDLHTAVVESMPGEVIRAGLADEILSPQAIAQYIYSQTKKT